MFLDTTTRKLQLVLVSAPVTTQPSFVTSYADLTATTLTPAMNAGQANGVTAVDIVAAPAGSTQRQIKAITIYNADDASIYAIVRLNDNGTIHNLVKMALAPGQSLIYSEKDGWITMPGGVNGFVPPPLTTVLTTSGTYITPTGAKQLRVRMVGGGGGGGGSGTAGSMNGGAGGGTTFNSVTANGGSGTSGNANRGGAGGTGGSGTANIRVPGNAGQSSDISGSNTYVFGGAGAGSIFGGGATSGSGAGTSAAANTGAGGSGAELGVVSGGGGGGGGSGEYVELIIDNPGSSYAFTIGAAGTAGPAGTSGFAGGAGGSGRIEVTALFGGAEINFVPGQLRGTSTNDDASVGNVGEYLETEVPSGTGQTPASGAVVNIATRVLGPGDWNVWGLAAWGYGGGQTATLGWGWLNTTSGTMPTAPNKGAMSLLYVNNGAGDGIMMPIGQRRYTLANTTTIYLSGRTDFTGGGNADAYGFIGARRIR